MLSTENGRVRVIYENMTELAKRNASACGVQGLYVTPEGKCAAIMNSKGEFVGTPLAPVSDIVPESAMDVPREAASSSQESQAREVLREAIEMVMKTHGGGVGGDRKAFVNQVYNHAIQRMGDPEELYYHSKPGNRYRLCKDFRKGNCPSLCATYRRSWDGSRRAGCKAYPGERGRLLEQRDDGEWVFARRGGIRSGGSGGERRSAGGALEIEDRPSSTRPLLAIGNGNGDVAGAEPVDWGRAPDTQRRRVSAEEEEKELEALVREMEDGDYRPVRGGETPA